MINNGGSVTLIVLGLLVVTGCAAAPSAGENPTTACPENDGGVLPNSCAPYDPEDAMALNDLFRERPDLSEAAITDNSTLIQPLTERLESLRSHGNVNMDSVVAAIEAVGLVDVQIRDDHGDLLFGAPGPAGGCIFGEVSDEAVLVETGGFIMDGGCLAMQ